MRGYNSSKIRIRGINDPDHPKIDIEQKARSFGINWGISLPLLLL
jgi:hypothetical protein